MNGYELIMKLQSKMQDPNFAARFNKIASEFNAITRSSTGSHENSTNSG